jgi:predicted Fe-Mo cluster-binding NifX family protein
MVRSSVQNDNEFYSRVFYLFGPAPKFIIADIDTNTVLTSHSGEQCSAYGAGIPLNALDNERINAILMVGIVAPNQPSVKCGWQLQAYRKASAS